MEVLHAHCAGLDVHKDTIVACARHMVDVTAVRLQAEQIQLVAKIV